VPSEKPSKKKLDRARLKVILADAGDLIRRSRNRLLLGLPLLLINRVTGLVLPWVTKDLIDEVIGKGHHEMLWKLATISAVVTISGAVTDYALAQILGMAAQKSITELRRRIQDHVQRLPVRFFDDTKTGTLVSRVMNDAEGIRNLVGTGLLQLIGGLVTAVVATVFLFRISARLATVILVASVAFIAVLVWAFRTARPLFKKRGELYSNVTGRLTETISGIRVVKAYTAEKREARVFAKGAHVLLRNVLSTMRVVSGVGALTTLLVGIVTVTVLIVGGREVIAGRMTVGGLISFTLYLGLVVGPVVQIVSIGTQLSEAFAGLERIREILGETREDAADASKPAVGRIEGKVELRDVWFEYTPGAPVLKGINLTAAAGTSIALVGPSGSGKSTLISLVAAFHRPTAGELFIDERPLSELRIGEYRANLGIVPQDSFLFAESIYDNIALGDPQATREEVMRAAKVAHVDEFAEKFEQGYDTIVGERGVKLSGGQKQRVAIARAIVASPRILILDEATSSLDSESEAMIQDGLHALMKGRTTFVIAHRLSTIRRADQIVVLENGEVRERGTHSELMALRGRYRSLYEKQYGVVVNQFINPGEEIEDLVKL
jgi:ABC-type multidrug transport system fused ATPase/permease subunit